MYFPSLTTLRKKHIHDKDIELLDWWLGTRQPNTYKYLNPYQFSIDCRVDANHALKLFSICTLDSEIALFSTRYVSNCINCGENLSVQRDYLDLNKFSHECYNCGAIHTSDLLKESCIIYFQLLHKPLLSPIEDLFSLEGQSPGKASSLHGSEVRAKMANDDNFSRLFSCIK